MQFDEIAHVTRGRALFSSRLTPTAIILTKHPRSNPYYRQKVQWLIDKHGQGAFNLSDLSEQ